MQDDKHSPAMWLPGRQPCGRLHAQSDLPGSLHRTQPVTTEIATAPEFYYAEDYHQQYLAKNPGGYCGIGVVGVACPAGPGVAKPIQR